MTGGRLESGTAGSQVGSRIALESLLFNAVQDWVAHELRGERPSSLDPPGVAREPAVPGTGILGMT